MWAERGWRLKSLLSDEVFWVCSGGFQRPFGHSTASLLCSAPPATQSQRFVDMFAKHKQLGLQRNLSLFWGEKSRGGWVYSQFAAVSVSGRAGKAGLKEGKLLWCESTTLFRGHRVCSDMRGAESLSPPAGWLAWSVKAAVYWVSTNSNSGGVISEINLGDESNLSLGFRCLKGNAYDC